MFGSLLSTEDIEIVLTPYGDENEDTATSAVVELANMQKLTEENEAAALADAAGLTEGIACAVERKEADGLDTVAANIALEMLSHLSRRFDVKVPTPSIEAFSSPDARKVATRLLKTSCLAMSSKLQKKRTASNESVLASIKNAWQVTFLSKEKLDNRIADLKAKLKTADFTSDQIVDPPWAKYLTGEKSKTFKQSDVLSVAKKFHTLMNDDNFENILKVTLKLTEMCFDIMIDKGAEQDSRSASSLSNIVQSSMNMTDEIRRMLRRIDPKFFDEVKRNSDADFVPADAEGAKEILTELEKTISFDKLRKTTDKIEKVMTDLAAAIYTEHRQFRDFNSTRAGEETFREAHMTYSAVAKALDENLKIAHAAVSYISASIK